MDNYPTPLEKSTALVTFLPITEKWVYRIDLWGGLWLVALTEELVFRGLFWAVFRNLVRSRAMLVGVSAVVFGLIHWSAGFDTVLAAALWGILPMVSVMRTGSIYPAVVAHYLGNLVLFGGFV